MMALLSCQTVDNDDDGYPHSSLGIKYTNFDKNQYDKNKGVR